MVELLRWRRLWCSDFNYAVTLGEPGIRDHWEYLSERLLQRDQFPRLVSVQLDRAQLCLLGK